MTITNAGNFEEVRQQAESLLPPSVVEAIAEARQKRNPAGQLIGVLHKLQGEEGFLGVEQMDAVSQLMQIPAATVSGVASFYHFFRLNKMGRYVISVCMGTACYVRGADKVVDKLREELGIGFGETTGDGMFSLQQARCLGMCGLAPVLLINEDVYEKVTPEQVPALLDRCARDGRKDQGASAS
jgi:NADH:ubiquinone oxidoreductase subunit E